MDIYKSLKLSIGAVVKNPEMLKFIPDHLETEKMCKYTVKKLPFLIRYVRGQNKAQQTCDKPILKNGGTL